MIIGFDISMLVYQGSGVANYTYNLVKNLLLTDKKNEYRLFYSSFRKPKEVLEKLKEFKNLKAKVFIYPCPPKILKFLWNQHHLLPIEWLIGKVDIFHSSDFLRPPFLKGTKGITTIHDLTWKIFPQFHEKEIIEAHEKKLKKTIKYKDLIIVDSQNTKKDLLKFYPKIDKNKVYVIYPAVAENFKKINDKEKIKKIFKKYQINYPANFLLYVGAIEPRKKLDIAIKVFHQFISSLPKKEPTRLRRSEATGEPSRLNEDWRFLIVGRTGWKNEKIFKLVKDLNLEKKVIFVGYVKDEDLPYFYNGAKLTLYLSSYEGFGLPPLESLACGTPVLAGNNSSLKEILPEKYLVDITDRKKIFEKLLSLLKEDKSVKINNKFSWKKSAGNFLKIIENKYV